MNIEASLQQQVDMLYLNVELKHYFSNTIATFEQTMTAFDSLLEGQVLAHDVPATDNTAFFASATAAVDAIGKFDRQASDLLLQKVEQSRQGNDEYVVNCNFLGSVYELGVLCRYGHTASVEY